MVYKEFWCVIINCTVSPQEGVWRNIQRYHIDILLWGGKNEKR